MPGATSSLGSVGEVPGARPKRYDVLTRVELAPVPRRLLVAWACSNGAIVSARATKQEPTQPAASTRPCGRSASWNSAVASESIPPRAPLAIDLQEEGFNLDGGLAFLVARRELPAGLHAKSPFPER